MRSLWEKTPKIDLSRPAVRWGGAAGVLLIVGAIAATLVMRGGGAGPSSADQTVAEAKPAVVAAVTPVPVPEVEPTPEASIPTPEETPVEGMEMAASADGTTPTTDPAEATPETAAEAAARKRQAAEARKKRLAAQQRIEEIRLEREAAVQREQDEEIRRLLAAAKAAYAAGAVTKPAGDSAADRYLEVLKIRPTQPEARAGMDRIVNVLVEEARHAQSVGDAVALRKATTEIARVQPDNRMLPELESSLVSAESSRNVRTRREAADLDKVSRYIARAYELLDRKPFDMRAADAATKQYDLAETLVPMAPGLPTLKERLIEHYSIAVRTELSYKDSKRGVRAQRMIAYARKRNWMSTDLEELELTLKEAPVVGTVGAQ
jgi:hypothetical protein